jgi:hypothetical protein
MLKLRRARRMCAPQPRLRFRRWYTWPTITSPSLGKQLVLKLEVMVGLAERVDRLPSSFIFWKACPLNEHMLDATA